MKAQTARIERTYLVASTVGNALIGIAGIAFSFIASSQAILLDGLFNLTYCLTGLFTLKVAQLLQQKDDQDFPFGYAFFEPLVNGVKGLLVLGVTLMAIIGAVEALLTGGREIAAGPAIVYGILASTACWGLAYVTSRAAKRTGSPLVKADAENWVVNAAISSAVLLAFIVVFLIEGTALNVFAPYVDPALVILVVVISISVPVRMSWQALMELLNRAPQPDIVNAVEQTIETCTADLPVQSLLVRVIQPGRTRMVLVHVLLPTDYRVDGLTQLDAIRVKTLQQLRLTHPDTALEMVFTADAEVAG